MVKDLSASQFQALVGSRFSLTPSGGAPFEAELADVTLLEAHEGPRPQPFSAVFIDPRKSVVLPQQIFQVESPAVGSVELFLVPIGPDPKGLGMRYEAVFN